MTSAWTTMPNLGTQLDKLIEKGEEFMGEDAEAEEDGGGEHPLSGLDGTVR